MRHSVALSATAISVLLICTLTSMIGNVALADAYGPEISDVIMDPKYPQDRELMWFFAKVEDPDGIFGVTVNYCIITCSAADLYDNNTDGVYEGTMPRFAAGTVFYYEISAMDNGFKTNESSKTYVEIVSNISVEFQLDPDPVVKGKNVWANGTALYDGNISAPAENSSVFLNVTGTPISLAGTTNSEGNFNISFQAPDTADSYDVNATVANRSLAGYYVTSLTVTEPGDADGDGLDDDYESQIGTNPNDPDTDGDGLNDYEEVNEGDDGYITDPLEIDTDEDGLDDWEEVNEGDDGYITDPTDKDTDGDLVNDMDDWNPIDPNIQHPPEDDNFILILILIIVAVTIPMVAIILMIIVMRKREKE